MYMYVWILLIHSPPVELEEVLALVSACLEYETEVVDTLGSLDLCSELCELVLCTSDVYSSDELAVEVVKSDLDRTAVEKSGCAHCE